MPVYITQCTMPCVNCAPLSWAPRHSIPELAAHSQKYARLTRGMRLMSSSVKIRGLSHQAMENEPEARFDLGNAGMMMLEHRPFGVMAPSSSCSGVKLTELCGVAEPRDVAANDLGFVFRRRAVFAHGNAVTQRARPIRNVRRLVCRRAGARGRADQRGGATGGQGGAQKAATGGRMRCLAIITRHGPLRSPVCARRNLFRIKHAQNQDLRAHHDATQSR